MDNEKLISERAFMSGATMKHSAKAWSMAAPIYGAIIQHPFNQELIKGTLSQDKFIYYIEQDSLFLKDFATCMELIAAKIQPEYASKFLEFSNTAKAAAELIIKQYVPTEYHYENKGKLSRATLSFTSYLLRVASVEPVEIAVAAITPSFWLYRESALTIAAASAAHNPYSSWIKMTSSEEFGVQVQDILAIFDALAENTTDEIRKKMLEAFSKSAMLEWHFWNDVYEAIVFDHV
jgi:thiaminase (transcriptional activator TenA)